MQMSVVYIISSVQAFIFAFLIFNKKKKCVADKVFIALMLFLAIHLAGAYFLLIDSVKSSPYLLLDAGTMIFYPVMIFLYIQTLVTNAKTLTLKHAIHIIPIAVLYVLILPIRHDIIQGGLTKGHTQPFILYLVLLWGLAFNMYYIIQIFALLKKHNLNIKNNFSFSERIDLKWIRSFLVGYILVFTATLILSVFFNTNQIDIKSSNQIIYYLLCIFVYYIGYQGYKQRAFLTALPINTVDVTKAKKNEKSQDEIFISRLQQFMFENKPFLNPTLTLDQLAQGLNVPPYFLSQILNTELKCNFFDFVNNFRVEEFKRNLEIKSNTNYTLLALALDSGFNSKASFNRIFKNKTGLTAVDECKKINLKTNIHHITLDAYRKSLHCGISFLAHLPLDKKLTTHDLEMFKESEAMIEPTLTVAYNYCWAFKGNDLSNHENMKRLEKIRLQTYKSIAEKYWIDEMQEIVVSHFEKAQQQKFKTMGFIDMSKVFRLMKGYISHGIKNMQLLLENGLHDRIAFGNDSGASQCSPATKDSEIDMYRFCAQKCKIDELEINKQLIQMFTINGAKLMGIDNAYGSIEETKQADIAVFSDNPLNNIDVLKNKVDALIINGKMNINYCGLKIETTTVS